MPIEFRCGQCNQLLRVPDDSAGKNARCPKCQALMTVPAASTGGASPAAAEYASGPIGGMASSPGANPFSARLSSDSGVPGLPSAPANPFGDAASESPFGGPVADKVNPYASPSAAAHAYGTQFVPAGERPGLPWETQGQGLRTWWETSKLCMMQPSYAFGIMRQYGGMGSPMLFCGLGLAIGAIGQLLWNLPLVVGLSLFGNQQARGDVTMMIGAQIGLQLAQSVAGVLLGATLGLLIGTAIIHVCLMMVGGARHGFETTLRALAFAQGSTAWLNVIPCAGPLVLVVWVLVLEIIGIARAHETTAGKAALAIFLPMIVAGICVAAVIAIAVAIAVSARGR